MRLVHAMLGQDMPGNDRFFAELGAQDAGDALLGRVRIQGSSAG